MFVKLKLNGSFILYFRCNYLDCAAGMLARTQEEGAVNEGVSIENVQGLFAESARYPRLVLPSQRGQDEESRVIVSMVTLIFNLKQKKQLYNKVIKMQNTSLFGNVE